MASTNSTGSGGGSLLKSAFKEAKHVLVLGLPISISLLLLMGMQFVDTLMVGRYNTISLAAVTLAVNSVIPLLHFGTGILTTLTPIVAQLYGRNDLPQASRVLWQGLWISQILGLSYWFLLHHIEPLFTLLNFPIETHAIGGQYLAAVSWGLPALMAYLAFRHFHEGVGLTYPNMIFQCIGLLLNAGINFLLIYGNWGFPELGARGAGYATSIAQWTMLLLMIGFTLLHPRLRFFHDSLKFSKPSKTILQEILYIGIPTGLAFAMEVGAFAVVSLLMGKLGVLAIAGHQVALNFASLVFMVPFGMSSAITARVGWFIGRNQGSLARQAGWVGVSISFGMMIFSSLILFFCAPLIVSLYTTDPQVQQIGIQLLYMAGIFQISDGLQVSAFGALRGLKDTHIPMICSLISYWCVGIPVGYYLGLVQGWGAQGFWGGLIAGLAVAAVLHNSRFYWLTRKLGKG